MDALGRLFDIGLCCAPVDWDTADAFTGKRIYMGNAAHLTFVAVAGVGGANNIVFDVQQHTASVSGTSADLDAVGVAGSSGITYWYTKTETALDNDEPWVKTTQSVASEVTFPSADGAKQKILVIEIDAAQLADGYNWVSVDMSMTSSTSQLGAALYFLTDLKVQRTPANMPNLLNPGAANA